MLSARSMALSFSSFIDCIFFLMASILADFFGDWPHTKKTGKCRKRIQNWNTFADKWDHYKFKNRFVMRVAQGRENNIFRGTDSFPFAGFDWAEFFTNFALLCTFFTLEAIYFLCMQILGQFYHFTFDTKWTKTMWVEAYFSHKVTQNVEEYMCPGRFYHTSPTIWFLLIYWKPIFDNNSKI